MVATPTAAVPRAKATMFSSLAIRDYRYLWLGSLGTSFAMNMQMVARGWFIYAITTSSVKLAWVMLSFMVPQVLFSLLGGALADRFPKKRLMLISNTANMIGALVMAIFILNGSVTFWHFIALGFFNGTVLAFSMPARNSLIPEIVGDHQLVNAMALSTTSMNLARILGPAMAGILIAIVAGGDKTSTLGVGVVYVIITVLYGMSVLTVFFIRARGEPVPREDASKPRAALSEDIRAGLRYVWRSDILTGLILMSIVPFLFGMPVQSLMPAFNEEVLMGGPDDLGYIMGAMGVGAILGSLMLARLGEIGSKGKLMFATCLLWGIAIIAFCQSTWLPAAMAIGAVMGLFSSAFMSLNRALIQMNTEPSMRGRIMSIDMMAHGLMPLGIIPFAFLADAWDVGLSLTLSGICLAATTLLLIPFLRSTYAIDQGLPPQPVVAGRS